jgi:hypothetical protein
MHTDGQIDVLKLSAVLSFSTRHCSRLRETSRGRVTPPKAGQLRNIITWK